MHYIKEEINRLKTIGTLNARGKAKLKEFEHLLELAESELKILNIPVVVVSEERAECEHEWIRNPIHLDQDYCNKCPKKRMRY